MSDISDYITLQKDNIDCAVTHCVTVSGRTLVDFIVWRKFVSRRVAFLNKGLCLFLVWPPSCLALSVSQSQKLLNIAKELLQTEEAYVKRLNLLDQVTHTPTRTPSPPSLLLYTEIRCFVFTQLPVSHFLLVYFLYNQWFLMSCQTDSLGQNKPQPHCHVSP